MRNDEPNAKPCMMQQSHAAVLMEDRNEAAESSGVLRKNFVRLQTSGCKFNVCFRKSRMEQGQRF